MNEEALARVGPQRHKKKEIVKNYAYWVKQGVSTEHLKVDFKYSAILNKVITIKTARKGRIRNKY